MKIRVVTLCKNEETIMPFFMQHYLPWVTDIVIFDGKSTDSTLDIAKKLGGDKVIIKRFPGDSGAFVDDRLFKKIRNEGWKEDALNYDWIIVCDADEFLYSKTLYAKLAEYKSIGVTLPKTQGYEMIGLQHPDPSNPLIEQITRGVYSEVYNKNIIFDPSHVKELNYYEGGHVCSPVGNVVPSNDSLLLLHYRMLSYDYFVAKARLAVSRMSKLNLENNWGYHNNRYAFNHTLEDYRAFYDTSVELIN